MLVLSQGETLWPFSCQPWAQFRGKCRTNSGTSPRIGHPAGGRWAPESPAGSCLDFAQRPSVCAPRINAAPGSTGSATNCPARHGSREEPLRSPTILLPGSPLCRSVVWRPASTTTTHEQKEKSFLFHVKKYKYCIIDSERKCAA